MFVVQVGIWLVRRYYWDCVLTLWLKRDFSNGKISRNHLGFHLCADWINFGSGTTFKVTVKLQLLSCGNFNPGSSSAISSNLFQLLVTVPNWSVDRLHRFDRRGTNPLKSELFTNTPTALKQKAGPGKRFKPLINFHKQHRRYFIANLLLNLKAANSFYSLWGNPIDSGCVDCLSNCLF